MYSPPISPSMGTCSFEAPLQGPIVSMHARGFRYALVHFLLQNLQLFSKFPPTPFHPPAMKYELTHDTLAKLIFEKASTESRTRRKVEKFIRDRHEAYQLRGARLTQDDIDFVTPYLTQVNISAEEAAFVEYGRKALVRARRRVRTLVAAVLVVFAGLTVVSLISWQRANKREKAAITSDSLAQIAATAAKNEAENARRAEKAAQDSALVAQQARREAASEAQKARLALNDLQNATKNIVAEVLKDAHQDIYELRYAEALKKFREAYRLGQLPKEVARGLMELAFFYGETGQLDLAQGLVDTVATLNNRKKPVIPSQEALREVLQQFDAEMYDEIFYRYYPRMILVEGGRFTYQEGEDLEKDTTVNNFYLAETETTVWQYYLYVMDIDSAMAEKPSWGYNGADPVVKVNWEDSRRYARWLSRKVGGSYRLPGEVEWEFAARGGNQHQGYTYAGGNELDKVAWYSGNSESRAHPVKGKTPNELGFYDMSGNVGSGVRTLILLIGIPEWFVGARGTLLSTTFARPSATSTILTPLQRFRFSCLPVLRLALCPSYAFTLYRAPVLSGDEGQRGRNFLVPISIHHFCPILQIWKLVIRR